MATIVHGGGGGAQIASGAVSAGATSINVTGLGFRPRTVIYRATARADGMVAQCVSYDADGQFIAGMQYCYYNGGHPYYSDQSKIHITINDDGFYAEPWIEIGTPNYLAGTWVAIG